LPGSILYERLMEPATLGRKLVTKVYVSRVPKKTMPEFHDEDEERRFWAKADSKYWTFVNLKPSAKADRQHAEACATLGKIAVAHEAEERE
jgi:hypothetical protein